MCIIDTILHIHVVLQLMPQGIVFMMLLSPGMAGVKLEIYNLDVSTHCVKFLYSPPEQECDGCQCCLACC